MTESFQREREDLAAVFRWTARLGMHECVANHFSLAVGPGGRQFLVNPAARHFAMLRASELLLLGADDRHAMDGADAPDPTAWAIHSAVHRQVPHARCVLHLHPRYATALASLGNSELPPIDQNSMRFYRRVAIDDEFAGMGLDDEAERVAGTIGTHSILLMGNHGILAVGPTVALAFNHLYYYERACRNYFTALGSGLPLRVAPHDVAEKTAVQWERFIGPLAEGHLREIRAILDRDDPDYRV